MYMKKMFYETARAEACIFGIQHCYVELYINPVNHEWPHPGGH